MFSKRTMQAYLVLATVGLFAVLVVMLSMRGPYLTALIFGGIVALIVPIPMIWLFGKLGYPIGKPVTCERCGTELPALREPANFRQAMLGGYTCGKCGAELDGRGRVRS